MLNLSIFRPFAIGLIFAIILTEAPQLEARGCVVAFLGQSAQAQIARTHPIDRAASRVSGHAEVLLNRYRPLGLSQVDLGGRLILSRARATRLELRAAQTVAAALPVGSHLALLTHVDRNVSFPNFDGVLYVGPSDGKLSSDIERSGSNVSIKSLELDAQLKGNELDRMMRALVSNSRTLAKPLGLEDFLRPFHMTYRIVTQSQRGASPPKWSQYQVVSKKQNDKPTHPYARSHQVDGSREQALQLAGEFFRLGRHKVERGHTIIISATTEKRYQPTELIQVGTGIRSTAVQLRQHLQTGHFVTSSFIMDLTIMNEIFAQNSFLDSYMLVSDLSVVWVRRKAAPLILPVPQDLIDIDDY